MPEGRLPAAFNPSLVRDPFSQRGLDGPDGVGAVSALHHDRERPVGGGGGTLAVVVGRRDGADAVRAVEAAL